MLLYALSEARSAKGEGECRRLALLLPADDAEPSWSA